MSEPNVAVAKKRADKAMKSDEDERMISAEAPVMFAKACEFFILELTMRAWNHAKENKDCLSTNPYSLTHQLRS